MCVFLWEIENRNRERRRFLTAICLSLASSILHIHRHCLSQHRQRHHRARNVQTDRRTHIHVLTIEATNAGRRACLLLLLWFVSMMLLLNLLFPSLLPHSLSHHSVRLCVCVYDWSFAAAYGRQKATDRADPTVKYDLTIEIRRLITDEDYIEQARLGRERDLRRQRLLVRCRSL